MAQDGTVSPDFASYWENLDSATQTVDNLITLTLKTEDQGFAWNPIGSSALVIMPKAFWQQGKVGTTSGLLTGSGPYQVSAFASDHIELTRSDNWWGPAPKIAKIRFDFVTDDNTRLLSWSNGEADMAINVPLSGYTQWSGSNSRVVFEPDRSFVGLTFNVTTKPFNDAHVRLAIAYAIDRAALVSNVLKGKGQLATALSTPEQFGGLWSPEQASAKLAAVPQYNYSLERAKAAMAQSVVPDGFTADLTYPDTGPQLGTAAQVMADSLKAIGITLNVKQSPIETWLNEIGQVPLGYMWYFNTTGDPGELSGYLLAPPPTNPAGYDNSQVFDLMSQAAKAADPAQRAELLIQAQVTQGANLAYLPLWWGQAATAFKNTIGVRDFSSYTLVTEWPSSLYAAK
jgi:peptide/nickel transport system substrate-binding protein